MAKVQADQQVVRFEDFSLEPHVRSALEVAAAQASARGDSLSALDCLVGAAAVADEGSSAAFQAMSGLLSLPVPPRPRRRRKGAASALGPALAHALSLAQPHLDGRVWGRDLVTLALLSEDPVLAGFAADAGHDLDAIRDRWFGFVVTDDRRHTRADWEAWWRDAGFTPPARVPGPGGQACLLVWDPRRLGSDKLADYARAVQAGGAVEFGVDAELADPIAPGTRVYLLSRDDPVGVIGVGSSLAPAAAPRSGPATKTRKRAAERAEVRVRWDRLSRQPLLGVDELIERTGEKALWFEAPSGTRIDIGPAAALEAVLGADQAGGGKVEEDAARFAKTLSDLDHSNDWIGIRPDVEALSTLMSVNRLEPPLSIAIFGDWGSGKTFLMRKIQERVRLLEGFGREQANRQSGEPDEDQPPPARYCNSILQIEFNAWHYTESNLWASLLNHIFEKLQEKLSAEGLGVDQAARKKHVERLFRQFETARAARAESEARIQRIGAETRIAGDAVGTAEDQLGQARSSLSRALGRSAWRAVDKALRESDSPQATELNAALKHFGFDASLASAQSIYATVTQFRSVSGRAREVLGSLVATREGQIGAAVVALAVAVVGVAMLQFHPDHASGATFATAITSGLAWVAERATTARKWLDKVQAADAWLTQRKDTEDSRIARLVEAARANLNQRQAALSDAQRQLREARTREATARSELEKATARDQMRRFVDARIADRGYARHLGLVSMIRRDFEDLSDFMYRDRQAGEARLVRRVSQATLKAIPTVERIILYIDDLDRCQPDRVVEVLEAVHLLMAFRLFVVVVAVDPRWALEALQNRYPHLASPEPGHAAGPSSNGGGIEQASTHDYIEKIFHIPFWVKPMTPNACKDLVAGYFDFDRKQGRPDGDRDGGRDEGEVEARGSEEERYHEHKTGRRARESTVTEQSGGGAEGREPRQGRAEADELHAAERAIRNVSIGAEEREFIESLAPHLGNSPRRIKRFANVYRLLKSGLSRTEARSFAGASGSGIDYRVVLTFLAIVTGAPTLAPLVLADAYRHRREFAVSKLEQGLDQLQTGDADELANARGALKRLDGLSVDAATIELWAPRVMRYGFNMTPIDVTEGDPQPPVRRRARTPRRAPKQG